MGFDNFRDNRLLKDYLRIKEEQEEISNNIRKKRNQQQNKERWARYQQYLTTILADKMLASAAGSSSEALLLDLFPSAATAYSLRKLRSAYTGNAIRVRKEVSSVDEETNIGFDANGNLDTTALLSFASDADGGNVTVSIWYDQSENDNRATNTTAAAQPLIVDGGTLVTKNGSVAVLADGVNDVMSTANSILSTDFGVFVVGGNGNIGTGNLIAAQYSSPPSPNGGLIFGGSQFTNFEEISVRIGTLYSITGTPTSDHHLYYYNRGGSSLDFAIDGGAASNQTNSNVIDNVPLELFGVENYSFYNKTFIKELIIYPSDQSLNRTGIESNINDHFDIYT